MTEIERHVYQSSQGGSIYCPLEYNARIFRGATPLLSRQVSSKYSEMSAGSVKKDLSENHGRFLSSDYIQNLASEIGSFIESKESTWTYTLPSEASDCKIVSIGRDGTTMPILGEGYRETMNGTISFYNQESFRVHTIYLANAPEYGKSNFSKRFSKEIESVKSVNPQAVYLGLADGAKENWTYLEDYVDTCILDYWHACEYLTKASKAFSRYKKEQTAWAKKARKTLKNNKKGAKIILRSIKKFRDNNLSKNASEGLEKAITYFTNHHHQMNYKDYQQANYPIGSGVTEAACKLIVKQRTNQSGMRWKINNAQKVLNIRALHRTKGRWKQFWDKVDKLGIAA